MQTAMRDTTPRTANVAMRKKLDGDKKEARIIAPVV